MSRILAVIACLTAGLALGQSVPGSISFNARLTDTAGAPLTGPHTLGFGLYDQPTGGAATWTENWMNQPFSAEGLTYVELGSTTTLTPTVLDGRKLYLEMSVDGTTMAPRLAIVSVPYALRASVANTANSVGTLTEPTIQRRVTGTCAPGQAVRSIDASGGVQCEVAGDITAVTTGFGSGLTGGVMSGDAALSLSPCAAGEVHKSGGTSWACAPDAVGPTYGVMAPLTLTGTTLSLSGCPNNQVLKSNGTTFVCADTLTGVTTASASGLTGGATSGNVGLALTSCPAGQVLKATTSGWACAALTSPQSSGLLASFDFEEMSGTTFADSSGSNPATFVGGLTAGALGHTGSGASFAGGVATVAANNDIPNTVQVQVEAWIRPQSSSTPESKVIVAKRGAWSMNHLTGTGISDLEFKVTTQFSTPDCIVATSGANISTAAYSHVQGFYDGLVIGVVVNGTTVVTAPCAKGPLALNLGTELTLGGPTTSGFRYLGFLDSVRVRAYSNPPGDRRGVIAGDTSITVGGTSTSPTIAVNQAVIQARVVGSCAIGQAITQINADGTIVCRDADQQRVFRYALFNTYNEVESSWFMGNNAAMFGGVNPSTWTDSNGIASNLQNDAETLRTIFNRKMYPGANALVNAERWADLSSTNGRVQLALLRVKNSTGAAISWPVSLYYTAFSGWGEQASIALNGVNQWNSGTSGTITIVLSLPANRISTVIVHSTDGSPWQAAGSWYRAAYLAFYNNCLNLPTGLTYVDDLANLSGTVW